MKSEIKYSFSIKNENLDEVKETIRNLDSLRFECNPFSLEVDSYFSVLGNVEDINKLQEYIASLNPKKILKVSKKKGLLSHVLDFIASIGEEPDNHYDRTTRYGESVY